MPKERRGEKEEWEEREEREEGLIWPPFDFMEMWSRDSRDIVVSVEGRLDLVF